MTLRKFLTLFIIILMGIPPILSSLSVSSANAKDIPLSGEKIGAIIKSLPFDQKIKSLMRLGHMPSLAACIIKNDTVVWTKGYGFYNRFPRRTPSDDTIYPVASMSKSITATAIMQLYEQGEFDLDDDVSEKLGFTLRNPNYPDVPITYRMLLAHQAGLTDYDPSTAKYIFIFNRPFSYVKEILVPEGEDYHPGYWGQYPPGTEANYSNFGYIVLGCLLENITSQSLEEYCKENIFEPLNMKDSSFDINNLDRKRLAHAYYRVGGFYIGLPHRDSSFADPCGGLRTTVEDLSHFLIAHMNGGVYNDVRILNESTVDLMHTIQYPDNDLWNGYRFGLGWLVFTDENGETFEGHDGDIPLFHARMRIRESDNISVICLFNMDSSRIHVLRNLDQFFCKLSWSFCFPKIMDLLFEQAEEL